MDPIKCKNCEVVKELQENIGDPACCVCGIWITW